MPHHLGLSCPQSFWLPYARRTQCRRRFGRYGFSSSAEGNDHQSIFCMLRLPDRSATIGSSHSRKEWRRLYVSASRPRLTVQSRHQFAVANPPLGQAQHALSSPFSCSRTRLQALCPKANEVIMPDLVASSKKRHKS